MTILGHKHPTSFPMMLPSLLILAHSPYLPNTTSYSSAPSSRQPTSNSISLRSKPTVSQSAGATLFSRVHPNVTSSAPGSRSNLTFAASTLKSSRPSGAPAESTSWVGLKGFVMWL
ncbi:hypothetical protein JB92DRAFT_2955154 [Gautieria morchelliformis]|nr:hypothetical protein JB92DRAFT_2955154 [Gautieria morchelliformis]